MDDFLIGTGQVQLKNLRFENSSRDRIERPREQLTQVFENRCDPFAYENHIPVALFPEELEIVLRESRVSMQDLVGSQVAFPKLYPSNSVRCVHGWQRFEAAIHVKGPEWWWAVRVYCVPRGSDVSRLLYKEVDQYYFQTPPTDAQVFLKVRKYTEEGKLGWAADWRTRLSRCKQTALKVIEGKKELLKKLDQLRPFPGLWVGFQLGNIEKYIALHILDEILYHLQKIYDFWDRITLRDPWVQSATDAATVRALELRATHCEADREVVRQLMRSGALFTGVSEPATRQRIQQEILQTPRIIPSIRTFQENMKWLTVSVQILKDLIIDNVGKRPVREAMQDCWTPPPRCLVEVGRNDCVQIPASPTFELAYLQVLVATLRGFPYLSGFAPRCEKGQRRTKMAGLDDAYVAEFLRGAHKQGFWSAKMQAGLHHTRETTSSQDSETSGVDPSFVDTSLERRCGRPFTHTFVFLESRFFLDNLLTLDESQMDYPSSLFIQRDFLSSFLGEDYNMVQAMMSLVRQRHYDPHATRHDIELPTRHLSSQDTVVPDRIASSVSAPTDENISPAETPVATACGWGSSQTVWDDVPYRGDHLSDTEMTLVAESPRSSTHHKKDNEAVQFPYARLTSWAANRSQESRSIFSPRSLAAALGPPFRDAETPGPLRPAHPPRTPPMSALSTSAHTSFSTRSCILPESMRPRYQNAPKRAARIWRQRPSFYSTLSYTSEDSPRSVFSPSDLR